MRRPRRLRLTSKEVSASAVAKQTGRHHGGGNVVAHAEYLRLALSLPCQDQVNPMYSPGYVIVLPIHSQWVSRKHSRLLRMYPDQVDDVTGRGTWTTSTGAAPRKPLPP